MPNVVATLECGYAFRLMFCHSANKNRNAQIISGYVPFMCTKIFTKQKKTEKNACMFILTVLYSELKQTS